jgi:hypothetical protein
LLSGVFLGSAAWAPLLAAGITHSGLRRLLAHMHLLNRLCGGLITASGLFIGCTAFFL